ncbi:MAG TPA: response regulator [Ktedonobacteraceae bacterium]|nr:response regulator [Ktedonobacteraceae bacterium]
MGNATTILIIDDSASACQFMALALEKVGYQVMYATDGHEGVRKALQEGPHCVILDVILPGINGFEVCRRLRASDPDHRLLIILVSTKNTPVDQRWGLRQGADRYLPKPFTAEALVQVVGDVLPEHLRPPAAFHHGGASPQRLAGQKLIPHRSEDPDLLRSSNPLDGSVVISDKQARRLYAAIDGRQTVDELCSITHLNMKEVHRALQILLTQHRIQLYTIDGKRVDSSLFLNGQ